jgi:hypothetical protein
MDDPRRGREPPLEVQREFTSSRLEVDLLTQTYQLIVPVIRRPTVTAPTLWDLIDRPLDPSPSGRLAQGA